MASLADRQRAIAEAHRIVNSGSVWLRPAKRPTRQRAILRPSGRVVEILQGPSSRDEVYVAPPHGQHYGFPRWVGADSLDVLGNVRDGR